MHENDNLNFFLKDSEDRMNTAQNEDIIAEAVAEVTEEMEVQPEQTANEEVVSTGFVMVETPEVTEGMPEEETQQESHEGTLGAFSGSYMQQNEAAQEGSNAPVYNAKEIQPRKKMGWGKRILIFS